MVQEKELILPYNFFPRWYQLPFLASTKRFKILVIHRRAGKSMTLLNNQIAKTQQKFCKRLGLWVDPADPCLTNEDKNRINIFYYVLPTYKQAKSVMWDALVRKHVPNDPRIVYKMNGSELAIYYSNGSIQRFVGCEDIDKHRGTNPIDVVMDEYSEMDPEIWTAIFQPVLNENKGTASFGFTPKGKNHSFHLLNYAKANPDIWFTEVLGVSATHAIGDEELEETKRTTPQALYMQEYEVEFNESAGAFFRRVQQNVHNEDLTYNPNHIYRMGVDLAMHNDYTVITILDLNTLKVHKQTRFNQIDWNLQKARIEAEYYRFGCPEVVIDATGVGEPIVMDLEDSGLNILPFKFSVSSKSPLLSNLAVLLEQDKIKIPRDPILIAELESITCGMTEKGKLQIITPKNAHDDMVMSLALACHEITERIPGADYNGDDWIIKQQRSLENNNKEEDLYNGI